MPGGPDPRAVHEDMHVFIAWAGNRSKAFAESLCRVLKMLPIRVEPWVSGEAIDPGTRWNTDIAEALEGTNYGVLCMTSEALDSRWIHFEAGALGKRVSKARVVPLLLGVSSEELRQPLAQFNVTPGTLEGVIKLIVSMGQHSPACKLEGAEIEAACSKYRDEIEAAVGAASASGSVGSRPPTAQQQFQHSVLASLESISKRIVNLQRRNPGRRRRRLFSDAIKSTGPEVRSGISDARILHAKIIEEARLDAALQLHPALCAVEPGPLMEFKHHLVEAVPSEEFGAATAVEVLELVSGMWEKWCSETRRDPTTGAPEPEAEDGEA